MAYGLTTYGFEKPSYDEWLQLYKTTFKNTFGIQDPIAESSLINDLLSIFALQDIKLWESLEAVYNSQTLTGAEGIYLDEVLGRRGIFRSPAAAGTGIAIIKTLRTAPWGTVIPTTSSFSGSNSINYKPVADTQIKDKIYALKIPLSDFGALAGVTFSGKNASTSSDVSVILNPQSATFLDTLVTWLQNNIFVEDTTLVFHQDNIIYVGFETTDLTTPVGVSVGTEFYATVNVGEKWSGISVEATETGYNPLLVGELNSVTPASYTTGSVVVSVDDVTNFTDFQDGSAVETDAEYRIRFNNIVDEALAATRPAITNAILKLQGVSKVRIYDNPTDNIIPEASPFSFNTVVVGGSSTEISQTLYDTKPVNTVASGTVSTIITTEDGGSETVSYTPATLEDINIKIEYKTVNQVPLSDVEQEAIKTNLLALTENFLIGDIVFTAQIQAAVFSAVGYARFSQLVVKTKKVSEADSAYSTTDYSASFSELPVILSGNILFEQSL